MGFTFVRSLKNAQRQAEWKRRISLGFPKLAIRAVQKAFFLLLAVLLWLPASLFSFSKVRCQLIDLSRIGHMSIILLCSINDHRFCLSKYRIFVPMDRDVANPHLLKYFPSNFVFLKNRFLCVLLRAAAMNSLFKLPADEYVKQPRARINAYNILRGEIKTLELSDHDENWLQQDVFKRWELQTNWFVCIQNRTSAYAPFDEDTQDYRNCSIAGYELAIDEIIRRGGTVFRIGYPDEDNLEERAYLYDIREQVGSRLHLALVARCKFFLGCSSGISFLATAFGRPLALANMVPLTSLPYTNNDIALHKRIYSNAEARMISFEENLELEIRAGFISSMYNDNYIPVENDATQILQLVEVMFGEERGKVLPASEFLNPTDYAYPSACDILKFG
jgi:putative glycosyltransferase (TIGR04372 family)